MSNPLYASPRGGGQRRTALGVTTLDSAEMPPKLEATFVPGGFDDYYMPEVIAPSPQRVMPEVPQNMQQGLQHMELEAHPPPGSNNTYYEADATSSRQIPHPHGREPSLSSYLTDQAAANGSGHSYYDAPAAGQQQPPADDFKPFSQDRYGDMPTFDAPSFSPFPRAQGDNVPPSDEEKEEILYNARQHVLNSNNVSMQLVWARDALSWVEIAAEASQRENKDPAGGRPQTPKVEHELRVDAINIVDYLSSQGHPEALFMRSKWLEFGRFGFRPDKKEAYLGYKKAAEQGWGRAEYRMGMLFEGSNDMDKALHHYNQGLAMNDSAASYRLGMMSLLGQHGYRRDYQRGLELIEAAADTADEDAPQGAYVYGMLISRELPDINIPDGMLPFNLSLARQYIEKAAYLGFSKAQLKMGQAYELCQLSCDFNPALSLHYYGLAARQGQAEAALGVSRWFLFGYEGVFFKNEQLAYQYARQAADAKLATGEFAMGYYSEIGIHVQKDIREARSWYERAAEHGNKDAINRLEGLDHSKTLTKKDHETTALTRIKSQHGSQRGKRPERFATRNKESALPTVSEAENAFQPNLDRPSPNQNPVQGDPPRPPAFALNIDQSNLALRPKSAAPYPVDDRPEPLSLGGRSKSAAPYPDDEPGRAPVSPHYNPQIRSSNAPGAAAAMRPNGAFTVRPVGQNPSTGASGPRPIPMSQSTGSLVPESRPFSVNMAARPVSGEPQRNRIASAGWEPQAPAGSYRNHSPGRGEYQNAYDGGYQQQQQQQQLPPRQPGGSLPSGDPARNRLSKANPNPGSQRPPQSSGGQGPPGGIPYADLPLHPGREYGPRVSSRPVSNVYMAANPHAERVSSSGIDAGRQSAPPMQMGGGLGPGPASVRPVSAQQRVSNTQIGTAAASQRPAAAAPKPAAKPVPQGPATFEEMGIPPGKSEADCIIM